jgi:hypothetical protein
VQIVDEAALLADRVEELAVDGVDVDGAVLERVEDDRVQRVGRDLGKTDREVYGVVETAEDLH